jgi:hypothetical protein
MLPQKTAQTFRERLGLKLLHALMREKSNGKSLLDCRSLSAIAKELRFSQSDFDAAIGFLIEKRAINAVDRSDGKSALPSPQGEMLLAARKEQKAWTFDRRLALYPIIIALVSLALAAAGLSQCMRK